MLTDLLLYLLVPLAFIGFFLMLLAIRDSPTEAEHAANHPAPPVAHANTPRANLVGFGILAGIYLALFLYARFIGQRHA